MASNPLKVFCCLRIKHKTLNSLKALRICPVSSVPPSGPQPLLVYPAGTPHHSCNEQHLLQLLDFAPSAWDVLHDLFFQIIPTLLSDLGLNLPSCHPQTRVVLQLFTPVPTLLYAAPRLSSHAEHLSTLEMHEGGTRSSCPPTICASRAGTIPCSWQMINKCLLNDKIKRFESCSSRPTPSFYIQKNPPRNKNPQLYPRGK